MRRRERQEWWLTGNVLGLETWKSTLSDTSFNETTNYKLNSQIEPTEAIFFLTTMFDDYVQIIGLDLWLYDGEKKAREMAQCSETVSV